MKDALQHKVIWVLSPEQWSNMRLSKHHYAEALAIRGNQTYFIEPGNKFSSRVEIKKIHDNLTVVNHPLKARGWGKLPGFLYRQLVKREIRTIIRSGVPAPDVVWCFDPLRFAHLNGFKKAFTIYHPVDQFDQQFIDRYPHQPDLAFSTMESEVKKMRQLGWNVQFLHHGIAKPFEELAEKRLDELSKGLFSLPKPENGLNIGFSGNLLGEASDRVVMKAIIEKHPDCMFHFWGKFENDSSYIQLGNHHPEFTQYLKEKHNVKLHGVVSSRQLAEGLHQMNMLWMIWRRDDHRQWNAHTNPHKVMEYLSAGVPVVTHYMHNYQKEGLLDMAGAAAKVEDFENLFDEVKQRLLQGSPAELPLMKKRIAFALQNTYHKLIDQAANHIAEVSEIKNA